MTIVGGTYLERTEDPRTERVLGSGLRAAAALAGSGSHRLHSCVDEVLRPSAEATASPFRLVVDFAPRELPVGFGYHSPLGTPAVDGLNQPTVPLTIDARPGAALVFGMLESEASIDAEGIVFDPQRPRGPRPIDRSLLRAQRFALVANATEICTLGRTPDVNDASRCLLTGSGADVVVVKRGALGAIVFEATGQSTPIGPHRTDRVWPIGSGDVFTAAFAWAWLEDGRLPVDSAELASACAAAWCSDQRLPLGLRPGVRPEDVSVGVALCPRSEPVRVYLAGPFFDAGSRWLVGLCHQALSHLGGRVFSPFHDVGLGGDEVARSDIEGLEGSEVIFALLDGADAGTLFELGYAAAKGIPMVGYAEHPDKEDYKMLRGLGAFLTDDLSTAIYGAIWAGMATR
jgi:nucleoside 2-deoxyribosyltransferase